MEFVKAADIKVIAALGDSLTVGLCVDTICCLTIHSYIYLLPKQTTATYRLLEECSEDVSKGGGWIKEETRNTIMMTQCCSATAARLVTTSLFMIAAAVQTIPGCVYFIRSQSHHL